MDNNSFVIFLLVFIRMISFLGTSPILMIKGIPNLAKAGLGLFISLLIFNFIGYDAALFPKSLMGFVWLGVGECVFGLALGYITSLFLHAVMMSGQLMDFQIGFTMASEFDPMTSGNVSLLGNLTHFTGLLVFFLINGHHVVIEALIESYSVVPVMGVSMPPEVGTFVLALFIKIVILSVKLAAPVVIVLFITEFTMGLIARTVPQLNILMLGLPVKVLVGLLAFSAALPGIVHMYVKAFQSIPGDINNFLRLFPLAIMFASGEKTEDPTPKKKQDARKKGQVAKSREFVAAITLIGITLLVVALSSYELKTIQAFLSRSLRNAGKTYMGEGDVLSVFKFSTVEFMKITLPVFAAVMALGVIANLIQTGFIYSTEPLKPQLNRLNPIEGFKRMFSGKAFMEMLKAIANIMIIGYVTYSFVKGEFYSIIKVSDMSLNSLMAVPGEIMQSELVRVAVIISVLGIIDLLYQKYAYKKELRMTKQEIKEEYKQMEGDPQIKSKIKQKQREMAQRRMMHEVPRASVVVTNPTHLAVALRYEQGKDSAPMVVAKGADLIASKIKQIAKENKVPVIENKPVARMLYERVEINESIPIEMYQAVAEILAVVYSLKKKL